MNEEVNAFREANKIFLFLAKMVRERKITKLEMQLVLEEGNEIYRHAGYLNKRDRPTMNHGDEYSGVESQANHLKRLKFVQLHPELKKDLGRYIEERDLVPKATFVERATGSVQLFEEYKRILEFIENKRESMEINREAAYKIYDKLASLSEDNGVFSDNIDSHADNNLLKKLVTIIKSDIRDISDELSGELNKLLASKRSK